MAAPKWLCITLVRAYVKDNFVDKGMCADFAIHDKGTGNPHVHIMLTLRPLKENGQWGAKCRKAYDLDENGQRIPDGKGGWKNHREDTTDWNDKGNVEIWRAAWAAYTNRALESAGRPERIYHRSYKRQGIDKIPSVHLGPAASQMEKRGIRTDIYQEANAVIDDNYDEHLSSYGTPEMVIVSNLITAAGGTARAAGVVRNTYTYYDLYTSGSTVPYTRTKAGVYKIEMISNGNNRFSMDDTYLITHSSMGANVTTDTAKFRCYNESDRTKYVDDSISVSNRIESYNYGSWNISISANPTSLPATGGTSTITSSCTRSKTPIYTSGSTGIATTESATPTLALTTNPGGFTLSGNKLTAANNPIGAKTATVTASYSGATSKSVSVSQAAGPDGIGYMQIQGDGTSHPIFRVGGNTRSVEPMSINETSETASDEDVSIFASIKKFLTKFV